MYLNDQTTACLSHWKLRKQRHAYWSRKIFRSSGLYERSND